MEFVGDTIAAIATPCGEGGIAVIRVSGLKACPIVEQCFFPSSHKTKKLSLCLTHTVHHGYIKKNNSVVDEVLVTVFHAPHSYTGEESVEISCHGGFVIARNVLETVLDAGARLAEPGEYTRRAFLNGRMDLTQAEAVVDLIHAHTERAAQAASEQLAGGLSRLFEQIRTDLLQSLAHIEAYIDFPDEDIAPEVGEKLYQRLQLAKEHVTHSLATFREGNLLRNGIRIAIVGRPNAGKSSLLNVLLKTDRAIVSPIPGTTRDTIEAEADIDGIPIIFVDTAGFRDAENMIEQEGVRRSLQWIAKADIILWVVDASLPFSSEDELFFQTLPSTDSLFIVCNKIDLGYAWNPKTLIDKTKLIQVSCLKGDGIPDLKKRLCEQALGRSSTYEQGMVTINSRHREGLTHCLSAIEESLQLLQKPSEPIELLASELHIAINAIGELLGKTTTEDLLDTIFSQFCIGK